jgi:hypothetical protein
MYRTFQFISNKSGIGLPHSKTLRMEWRMGLRVSVLECGSPMPLYVTSRVEGDFSRTLA